ncbi:MAG: DUF1345 domain-containing protein [Ferruginibacter sp.]
MTATFKTKQKGNMFLRMHPVERILLSVTASLITFVFIRNSHLKWELMAATLWDTFTFSFILTSWIVFFTRPVAEIIQQANKDDGSRLFVMVSIIISSFAGMLTVLLLMISKDTSPGMEGITIAISISGMLLSWMMVHTIFTFHYAHLYYGADRDDTPGKPALDFPGETKPDYIDFAYFSFVVGMTFQVSDVEIHSRTIRRTALAHSLLAFALNTFVVALTINLIAGLKN